ncbi:MAG TPA: HAD-IA family hydrolase [Terriglobales bacterium]|nr:HAD-IA family hydrolase [Terriglobales bacterium]
MPAFYFDVGGVLIADNFVPDKALETFRQLSKPHGFDPAIAYATYTQVQPALDLGTISLLDLCAQIGASQRQFEQDWLVMHPVDSTALRLIERLLAAGHPVGLATNFCRTLLNRLIESAPILSQLCVCCSSDIGLVKPSREFFQHACEILPAEEIVFVDDREINVQAARAFGWTAIHATEGWLSEFETAYTQ